MPFNSVTVWVLLTAAGPPFAAIAFLRGATPELAAEILRPAPASHAVPV